MAAYERRSFSEIAVDTTLSSTINDTIEAFDINDATGWPTGSGGPFFARIESEDILCSSRTGTSITVATGGRGENSTTAATHQADVEVTHVFTSRDADEANYTVSETVGKVTTIGDTLYADGANSLARLPKGTAGTFYKQGASIPAWTALASADISDLSETIADTAGAMFTGNTETGITATYQDSDNTVDLAVTDAPLLNGQAASFYIARANHTGTQLAATVSDFDTQVRTSRLDQMAAPNTDLSMASHKITNVTTPTAAADAATKAYAERFKTRYEQSLPGAGNWTTGQTLATLTITDPGYDILVWVAGSLIANANTLSYWEIQCEIDAVKVGGIVIPHAQLGTNQSYAVLGRPTVHSTGTNCSVVLKIVRFSGSGNFDTAANTGANNLLTAFYTST